jgi:hypothetical protein
MPLAPLIPMPRRHPLPLPARPAILLRLEALHLAGATAGELMAELRRDPSLTAGVEILAQLDPLSFAPGKARCASVVRNLALSAALDLELAATRSATPFEAHRRRARALLVARLCAHLARRIHQPVELPAAEFFALALAHELARARCEDAADPAGSLPREAARLAAAWGFSGTAVETLAASGGVQGRQAAPALAVTALQLAERLTAAACGIGQRADLDGAATQSAGRALGLRPAEIEELAEFAVCALAAHAA